MKKEKPIEEAVKEMDIEQCYTVVLSFMVWGRVAPWADWRDSWALLSATPKQKQLAFEVACVCKEVEQDREVANG